ncbi:HPP family protein [Microvirga arabica]|uniref:HPP family protein n=1 Tax=Microvirga arabica TaxID=1128671 RepID=UPI00193ABAF8|nr:HPP family protein [Microvirga arabica]MBM1173443.1 HPP family protein [Microvirga arabica]
MNAQPPLSQLRPTSALPPLASPRAILLAGLGGAIATLTLVFLAQWSGLAFVMAPFGATCVLAFALPDSPLSQPRSIVGGHLIATTVGLAVGNLLGVSPWTMALAVGLAIALMLITRTTHAPAGADPLLVMLAMPDWWFLLTPVLSGALTLVAVAYAYHRITGRADYPRYWFC